MWLLWVEFGVVWLRRGLVWVRLPFLMVLSCEDRDQGREASVEEYGLEALAASAEAVVPGLGPLAVMLARLAEGACRFQALDGLVGGAVEGGREVARGVAQLGADWMAGKEGRGAGVVGADGVARTRAERGRARRVVTAAGPVVVRRIGYRAAVAGPRMVFPLDGVLNLPASSSYSHDLAELVVMFTRSVSYEQAGELLAAVTGVRVGKRQLEQVTAAAAADAEAFYGAGPGAEAPPAGTSGDPGGEAGLLPLALSADGKGVAMRPESRRKRTRAPGKRVRTYASRAVAGEKRGTKRIAETACVFDVIPCPRTPEQVLASRHGPGGGRGDTAGPKNKKKKAKKPGPEAAARRYRCDIAADRSVSVKWLFDEADRRDPGHERDWIALVDGDNHQIALIQAEAAARGVTVPILIDLIHVMEYLWKAAWALHPPRDPAIETWTMTQVLDILHGRAAAVTDRIAALAAANPPPGPEHARNLKRTIAYLRAKLPYLGYPRALAQGWPVATGVIEGACRHLVLDRMGITGARWNTHGAQAILWHRVIHANDHHDPYWTYHLQQEHHRNHQTRYQNPDTLTLAA